MTVDEELAYLVSSLDDLEVERAAGDIDDADYQALKADYTVRIADRVRNEGHAESAPETLSTGVAEGKQLGRWLAISAIMAAFAVGAGFLLAATVGERGVGQALTGDISASPRQKSFECQELGANGKMIEALTCFDEVLAVAPENVEALTYRGWYLALTATSAEQAGKAEQGVELMASAVVYLDRAVAIDPAYPDARAFRSVVFDRLGQSDAVCEELVALLALDPPPFFVQQTAAVGDRNGC